MRIFSNISVFLVLLTACGGSAPSRATSVGGIASPTSDATYAGSSVESYGGQSAAEAGDYGGEGTASATSTAPHPSVRPGLATEWGETRVSRVRSTRFLRADASPFATVGIRYNDAQGVAEQAAHRSARVGDTTYIGAYRDGIRVSVTDEHGRPLPGCMVAGQLYVVGQPGQRYIIELTNATTARFEAVGTVDGLDVITGQPGSLEGRGYLLMPGRTLRIEGFRQSDDAVASFRFGSVGDSYAAQRGDARNVGVMGLAFFAEAGWTPDPVYLAPAYPREVELRETANPFPGQYAPPPQRRRYY